MINNIQNWFMQTNARDSDPQKGFHFRKTGSGELLIKVLNTHIKSNRLRCGTGERLGLAEWHLTLSDRKC